MGKFIYLDNNSTTPVDPAVFEEMRPYFTEMYGNPSNHHHAAGSQAANAIEKGRGRVAAAINAEPGSIVFTSGATESNNLAILGVCEATCGTPGHIVTSAIEHKAVIQPCRHLEMRGWKVTYLRPDGKGRVDWRAVDDAVTSDTRLVSIMAANNEIGTIQPIEQIGEICGRHGILFHCDAAQAFGKIPVDVQLWNVDFLSLSAHKAYGPKGVGALFVRKRPNAVALSPLCFGGGQENGLRPGTLPVPSIVGFGAACEIASKNLMWEKARVQSLADTLLERIRSFFPDLAMHGDRDNSLPGLLSLGFPGIDGDEFLFALRDIAVSQGSACTTGSPKPSHVLTAIGIEYGLARATFRFGLGRFTTEEEIERAAQEIARVISILR